MGEYDEIDHLIDIARERMSKAEKPEEIEELKQDLIYYNKVKIEAIKGHKMPLTRPKNAGSFWGDVWDFFAETMMPAALGFGVVVGGCFSLLAGSWWWVLGLTGGALVLGFLFSIVCRIFHV